MRTFIFEHSSLKNWERCYSVTNVKACTLKGAFKRARKRIPRDHDIYQVLTRIRGCGIPQPIWDFFNGSYFCPKNLI